MRAKAALPLAMQAVSDLSVVGGVTHDNDN